MNNIFFVASARDYHAIDWYRIIKKLCPNHRIAIVTDLIEGEGFEKIVNDADEVILLFSIDRLLLTDQSRMGNLWRNIVKLAALPFMAHRLRSLSKASVGAVFHAHSMYYITLCWLAGIRCVATPMGSDVLVRPDRSRLYRYFTIKALRAAAVITVDSAALQEKIFQLCGVSSEIVQNGIDTSISTSFKLVNTERHRILSIRGCDPNYRILEIIKSRNSSNSKPPLDIIYPFYEGEYLKLVAAELSASDSNFGRVNKERMYQLFSESLLVVSIPISDSSPRSVYEAIFCGCCVAVSYGKWIDLLPECMRSRLIVIDQLDDNWFDKAIEHAEIVVATPFKPTDAAIQTYDETEAMKYVCKTFYGVTCDQ